MKRNKIFAWMAAAMTFAACTNNDITSDTRYDDDNNVVNVGTVTRASEGSTTSQFTGTFLLTNVTQRENVGYDYEATYEYNSSNSTWTTQSNAKIMWYGSGDNQFQATYPCKTKNGNVQINDDFNKFVIPGYQNGRYDSIPDWMRATATVARSNGDLDIKFKHMLSKVTVEIDYSNNNIKLDGKAVTGASVSKIFTRVQFCEAVTGTGGNVTINPYQKTDYETDGLYVWTTPQSDAYKAYTTAIVAPGEYSKIAKAVIYCGGDEKEIVLSLPNGITLEAGKHYTFTLSSGDITHDAAKITSVSVEPWREGSDISSSKPAEFIPYVTFTSESEVKFNMTAVKGENSVFTISGLEYSVDNRDWTKILENGISDIQFGGGNSNLRLRGKNLKGTVYDGGYAKISFTPSNENPNAKVACTGDIRTLLDYENYNTVDTEDARFSHLFENCTQLTSAPELPATTIASNCYWNMFYGCTSLITAPALPAETLANSCYSSMFSGCTSLESAPELPATTLANSCYQSMFDGCTSLTTAPELKATTLVINCYSSMFDGCTSLTTAPELKATTLANSCYSTMFGGCTALTTAPALPATTLANDCYSYMFGGCTALTTAPELPATTLAESCYYRMFNGCTSLTQAPELKATTLADECYSSMFYGCTSLTTAPALKATTLAKKCYFYMFYGCSKLQSVTMLATGGFDQYDCLYDWLKDAGTDESVTQRTLKVANQNVYTTLSDMSNVLPTEWKSGTSGTTILDKDGNNIPSSSTAPKR